MEKTRRSVNAKLQTGRESRQALLARASNCRARARLIRRFDPGRSGLRIFAAAIPIQPDPGDAHLARRGNIVKPTARHMHPIRALHSGRFRETLEVAKRRLVGLHLLRGDDEIKPFVKRATRFLE